MENSKRILISLIGLVAIVALFYVVSSAITKYTGYSVSDKVMDKDEIFKDCLKDKDITLYLNTKNPVTSLKEISLYDYVDSIKIFNCQINTEACVQKNINGPFPVWIVNGQKLESDISLTQLESLTGCKSE